MTSTFGQMLRQRRQAAGLSLRQLAARVGYDHSYLSQVERGQRPGSVDLARLCDRELGTGDQLTVTFERRDPEPAVLDRRPAQRLQGAWRPAGAADPLELAWQGLVAAAGVAEQAIALGDFRTVPPASLLPELVGELQALQARGGDEVEAVELSVLIAETLTGLGERRTARRWWWAAQTAAASSGDGALLALVCAREAISGLVERRPLPELLELADKAVAAARQTPSTATCVPQVAQALVLAELERTEETHQALQVLVGIGDDTVVTDARPTDWLPYQLHWAEGRVCAGLGYGVPGCILLERARELCPETWVGERAKLDLGLAECLAVAGEVAAGLATALRVLVELPDEWHDLWVYDAADRVLRVVQDKEPTLPGAAELRRLLSRSGRSVGGGSSDRQVRG
ncbi:helix-turn-helix domain-containing protein [Kribbella kalugense]|uniref:helix-turn-helix domain-containing protein n=1 Tax=Kribbella kalugense TaxID=2512221 RepID=UPI001416FC11|nr:helix-turn-helix transcriptional regulator [Kribbella kalugense]